MIQTETWENACENVTLQNVCFKFGRNVHLLILSVSFIHIYFLMLSLQPLKWSVWMKTPVRSHGRPCRPWRETPSHTPCSPWWETLSSNRYWWRRVKVLHVLCPSLVTCGWPPIHHGGLLSQTGMQMAPGALTFSLCGTAPSCISHCWL